MDGKARQRDSFFKTLYRQRWAYFFLIPGLILLLLFNILPIIDTLKLSFFDYNIVAKKFCGLDNYIKVFTDKKFLRSYGNTFLYILIIVPLNVVISLLVSVVLSNSRKWLQSFFRGAYYLPCVVGGVVVSAVWMWIYHPVNGLMNTVLEKAGADPVYWLADAKYALISLCVVVLTWNLGQSIIVFLTGLLGINPDLYESARIDGANSRQLFFKITLPLLKPVTLFVLMTVMINTFQIWEVIYMLTSGGPNYSTMSAVYYMYNTAFVSGKYGLASAQGIVLAVTIMLVSRIMNRLSREGV